ncbi:LruC domain-containing protein [Photobacterium sanguinicancri]|uniref:LruC domain-containing protein n=1 Tax=Photobacterium sanguinicancri TaxID=875932 RepID=A0ABX4FZB1_9GAMM|nr:LruC domain-containing protein [Photobacterium sanguinicancri]OZS44032.1 LruC domain-containing protein [Photobacterium sanguinicancri]
MKIHIVPLMLTCGAIASSPVFAATPFSDCPTEAFLFQGNPSNVYGVDLSTGNFNVLQTDTGAGGTINAVGFNETDRYIYGWNKDSNTMTRINQLLKVENLTIQSGLPNKSYFVGDVFDNKYFLYLKGTGMFSIDLSAGDENLTATEILSSSAATLQLTDFAFYPETGDLFAVENTNNNLYRFSFDAAGNASFSLIGSTGLTGTTTFGAQYFDKSGFMYISNNSDGKIYRLDLRDLNDLKPTAEFFAQGPSSSQNDGARCASAPVIASNTDFGDAPDSYKTSLAENGPRHFIGTNFFLGSLIDAEGEALISPSSDDNDGSDDEDGITFNSELKQGSDALIQVTVGGSAISYVSAWFDWNSDGVFDEASEQIIVDEHLTPGSHSLKFRVPETAISGDTWARFRIAQNEGVKPFGGVTYGEVEDYSVTIEQQTLTHSYYPGEGEWATLAYEDNWPNKGDYDFNDVVMYYRVDTVSNSDGNIIRYDISGKLQAYGASFSNGFAVQLDNIARSSVREELTKLVVNSETKHTFTVLETGQTNAVAIISNDLKEQFAEPTCSGSAGNYYRVWRGCSADAADQFTFEVSIPFQTPLASGPDMPLNPFIFAREGRYRGASFGTDYPGRELEVHLKGDSLTSLASERFFSTQEDTSSYSASNCPGENCDSYRASNGTPWGLLIEDNWDHPSERVDILATYPELEGYATSGGTTNQNWFLRSKAVESNLFE